jgi:arylsulfatase A-like enzyme
MLNMVKVNNPKLLSLSLAGLMAFPASGKGKSFQAPGSPDKPNIVIIIADDLGWNDVGYHGSFIKTPNIDKLAQTGIRLYQHYAMATCTPTRVSLMTGRYPSRYGVTAPDYGEVIDLGDPTLASILSENGYFTAITGKWHMGSPPYTPLKYGFRSSYGYFAGQIDPYTHEYKTENEEARRSSWHRNDEYLREEGHATDLITNEAVRVINGKHGQPFFLYVAYNVPHSPLNEPEEWTSLYDGLNLYPSRKWYAASVSHMDAGIGKVIRALEQTGQRENTLVLFISDNGGQHSWVGTNEYEGRYADRPHLVLGDNFPLRGWKGELYEGGIRVPACINWPGHLVPGEMNFPVHVSDWLPTFCDLTGYKKGLEQLILDGRDIWPFLAGKQQVAGERPMYWKTPRAWAVRTDNWKLLSFKGTDKVELYDLGKDFRETTDVSEANPETVKQMMELLEGFKKGDR